jgi:hypothetical protein
MAIVSNVNGVLKGGTSPLQPPYDFVFDLPNSKVNDKKSQKRINCP